MEQKDIDVYEILKGLKIIATQDLMESIICGKNVSKIITKKYLK